MTHKIGWLTNPFNNQSLASNNLLQSHLLTCNLKINFRTSSRNKALWLVEVVQVYLKWTKFYDWTKFNSTSMKFQEIINFDNDRYTRKWNVSLMLRNSRTRKIQDELVSTSIPIKMTNSSICWIILF